LYNNFYYGLFTFTVTVFISIDYETILLRFYYMIKSDSLNCSQR